MKRAFSVLLLIILTACAAKTPFVEIGGVQVNVELPKTPAEMARGLMHRESLGENDGMLFVFEQEGKPGFWMKNTLIPLDMIFIDADNKIVDILSAEPCEEDPCQSYVSKDDAKYVLEVNQGFAQKHNIQIGDEVKLNI
ncbi:DUF192 domain-containing protein [Candidatus Woesearchaeota archaeon]|nr:DUF192 domain-containing protein [Candidatus Woesearchaeota archaeon]MBW3005251.1 DUF192 domain-containing protein [Candidatus Woesearchaeota archaeon]